jgi:hypothetical protein
MDSLPSDRRDYIIACKICLTSLQQLDLIPIQLIFRTPQVAL